MILTALGDCNFRDIIPFKVVDPDVEEDFLRYEVYELVKE